jgi:hypothetical protein
MYSSAQRVEPPENTLHGQVVDIDPPSTYSSLTMQASHSEIAERISDSFQWCEWLPSSS